MKRSNLNKYLLLALILVSIALLVSLYFNFNVIGLRYSPLGSKIKNVKETSYTMPEALRNKLSTSSNPSFYSTKERTESKNRIYQSPYLSDQIKKQYAAFVDEGDFIVLSTERDKILEQIFKNLQKSGNQQQINSLVKEISEGKWPDGAIIGLREEYNNNLRLGILLVSPFACGNRLTNDGSCSNKGICENVLIEGWCDLLCSCWFIEDFTGPW